MSTADDLDAIDILKAQHRAIDRLFREVPKRPGHERGDRFGAGGPAGRARRRRGMDLVSRRPQRQTEDLLAESREKHLAIKRLLADMLDEDVAGESFGAKLSVLEERVHHHAIKEEEAELFPMVRAAVDDDYRAALAGEMIALMVEAQEKGAPRNAIPAETDEAAPL